LKNVGNIWRFREHFKIQRTFENFREPLKIQGTFESFREHLNMSGNIWKFQRTLDFRHKLSLRWDTATRHGDATSLAGWR
jgi:hypothetical protein